MNEIYIPGSIKVGGFDVSIEMSPETDKELDAKNVYGDYTSSLKRIRLSSNYDGHQISSAFIHEALHAIDDIYNGYDLPEKVNEVLANGLHQLFEQLGIKFIR